MNSTIIPHIKRDIDVSKNDISETKSVTDEYGYTTEHTYYKKEKIENIAKKIFGNNVSITHESCEAYLTQAIDFKNGEYDCYEYQGGGDTPWEMSTSEIISAEQNGNELYIYDKYVHIYGNASSSNYDIYDSSDKSLKIAENVAEEKIKMKTKFIFNMVNTSLVLGLYPINETEFNKLIKLYTLIDDVKKLGYPLTPHITLGYYNVNGFSVTSARKLEAIVKELNTTESEIQIELDTKELFYQKFVSMNEYINIFSLVKKR